MAKPTVSTRLETMRSDLCKLVHALNKDKQHDVAVKAQNALAAIDDLTEHVECSEIWLWPPRVSKDGSLLCIQDESEA